MYIGTHNTMTYLPPKKWWMRLFNWASKCQDKDVYQQMYTSTHILDSDVDPVVDFRIKWKKGKFVFAHGLCEYKCEMDADKEIVNIINRAQRIYKKLCVRLILEKTDNDIGIIRFKEFCEQLERDYGQTVLFIGGNLKKTWEKLYTFEQNISDALVDQYVSSMANDARFYEKIFPKLYAKRMNSKNIEKVNKQTISIFDFI